MIWLEVSYNKRDALRLGQSSDGEFRQHNITMWSRPWEETLLPCLKQRDNFVPRMQVDGRGTAPREAEGLVHCNSERHS